MREQTGVGAFYRQVISKYNVHVIDIHSCSFTSISLLAKTMIFSLSLAQYSSHRSSSCACIMNYLKGNYIHPRCSENCSMDKFDFA